jgi:hypothetical protein
LRSSNLLSSSAPTDVATNTQAGGTGFTDFAMTGSLPFVIPGFLTDSAIRSLWFEITADSAAQKFYGAWIAVNRPLS